MSTPDEPAPRIDTSSAAAPTAESRLTRLPFPVVGIGASAGGIEALQEFFKGTRPDSGMAYVVVQHLSPEHQSLLEDILSRCTSMPVRLIIYSPSGITSPNQLLRYCSDQSLPLR